MVNILPLWVLSTRFNLIKYGSHAPQKLLREIYETSNMLGDVSNQNSKVLVENYLKNDIED